MTLAAPINKNIPEQKDMCPTYQANSTGFWFGLNWIQYERSNDPTYTWVAYYYAPKKDGKNKPDLHTAKKFSVEKWEGVL